MLLTVTVLMKLGEGVETPPRSDQMSVALFQRKPAPLSVIHASTDRVLAAFIACVVRLRQACQSCCIVLYSVVLHFTIYTTRHHTVVVLMYVVGC